MEQMKKEILGCVHSQSPFCTDACPFGIDMRDFMGRLARGRTDAVYRIYRNATVFPEIVSRLCPAPCKKVCARADCGGAIEIDLIEKSVVALAKNKNPSSYNILQKEKTVAVIGGGLSGLACALRLCNRKYAVTVYEKEETLGGRVIKLLPSGVAENEITAQFQNESCTFELGRKIESLADISADAYYIATGDGGHSFGFDITSQELIKIDEAKKAVLGGGLLWCGDMEAIVHGIKAAAAIDSFLTTGKFEPQYAKKATRLTVDKSEVEFVLAAKPQGELYTADELKAEGGRCIKCDCDACIKRCDLMSHYKKEPWRIVDEVDGTVNPGAIFSNRIATRLIASCEQCGMCTVKCPHGVDMQQFLLESRREMVAAKDMPPVFSAFWLEDMAHADTAGAFTAVPNGNNSSTHVFFPGCQTGASDLRYVKMSFDVLTKKIPSAGIMLGCCGIPAVWSGNVKLQNKKFAALEKEWERLDKPIFVLACPTCKKTFTKYFPQIKTQFIYDYIDLPQSGGAAQSEVAAQLNERSSLEVANNVFAVFDPCAAREMPQLALKIRELALGLGLKTEDIKAQGEALCCSFGGQPAIANPAMTKKVISNRTELSPLPYITYCTNCRDIFTKEGKKAVHIFDLLFNLNSDGRELPTWTKRRQNREELKVIMQEKFGLKKDEIKRRIKLIISDELKKSLDEQYTLEADVAAVISWCEDTNRKIEDKKDGTITGHLKIGHRTHWVKYKKAGDAFEVISAYNHRMNIKGDESGDK